MPKLILVRHGQSEWNLADRFTGWWDVDVTEKGVEEAKAAGRLLKDKGVLPTVAFTSVQKRAIKTLHLALEYCDRLWIPDMLKSRKVPADKLGHAVEKLRPVADFLDRYTGRRLEVLVRAPSQRLAGAICLLLAALVPPLQPLHAVYEVSSYSHCPPICE